MPVIVELKPLALIYKYLGSVFLLLWRDLLYSGLHHFCLFHLKVGKCLVPHTVWIGNVLSITLNWIPLWFVNILHSHFNNTSLSSFQNDIFPEIITYIAATRATKALQHPLFDWTDLCLGVSPHVLHLSLFPSFWSNIKRWANC